MKKDGQLDTLKNMIYFDTISEEDASAASEAGVSMFKYSDLISEGEQIKDEEANYEEKPIGKDTPYTFSYTSGTTGMPKGVILTHQNFVCNVGAMCKFDNGQFKILDGDVYISYLPLAHVFERFMYLAMMAYGVSVGFYQGDVLKLREDLAELKPTLMISVPRLFNRFYDVMQARINELTGMKRTICDWGVQKKIANYEATAAVTHGFYDAAVFHKF